MADLGTFTLPGDAAAAQAAVATPSDGDTVSIDGVTHTYAAAGTTWTPGLPSLQAAPQQQQQPVIPQPGQQQGGGATGTGTGTGTSASTGTKATAGAVLSTPGHLRNFTAADFAAFG